MKGLDTNVLIRHLVQDDAPQARLASRFIATESSREDPCFINPGALTFEVRFSAAIRRGLIEAVTVPSVRVNLAEDRLT